MLPPHRDYIKGQPNDGTINSGAPAGIQASDSGVIPRMVVIADRRMDWAARWMIASARLRSGFKGEVVLIGECRHPKFNQIMQVEYHEWEKAAQGLLAPSPWGAFRKPQKKPYLIRKFFKKPTIYLDADIFCRAPFMQMVDTCGNWACSVTRQNPDMMSSMHMKLWDIQKPPIHQYNSGVLVIHEPRILDEWCAVFDEAGKDPVKYDYLMNRQPWSYDQIGLIIAAARSGLAPTVLHESFNYEVAAKGWAGATKAALIHLTNWKALSYHQLQCLARNAGHDMGMVEVARHVHAIQNQENTRPAPMPVKNPLEARKAAGLVKKASHQRIIVGISQGIGNVILATPLLKALQSMGYDVDVPSGVYNNGAETILQGLGVKMVDPETARKRAPYLATLQSIWPVNGLEKLSSQTFFAPTCQEAWQQNLFAHEVEANMSLAYTIGYDGKIPKPYCHRQSCAQTEYLGKIPEKRVGIHVCTRYSAQLFANRRLYNPAKIAAILTDRGYRVVLLGGPGTTIDPSDYPADTIDLVGKLSIAQSTDAIARLDALVTEDCGMAHVAAAMDCPQVSIFGPTSVVKNRPWSDKAQVFTLGLPCQPCQFTEMANQCRDNRCMQIDPERIADHVDRMIGAKRSGPARQPFSFNQQPRQRQSPLLSPST